MGWDGGHRGMQDVGFGICGVQEAGGRHRMGHVGGMHCVRERALRIRSGAAAQPGADGQRAVARECAGGKWALLGARPRGAGGGSVIILGGFSGL